MSHFSLLVKSGPQRNSFALNVAIVEQLSAAAWEVGFNSYRQSTCVSTDLTG